MAVDRRLRERLDGVTADGYLTVAPGTEPDQRYLTGVDVPVTVVSLWTGDALVVLVRGLDASYVRRVSTADAVETYAEHASGPLGGSPGQRYLRSDVLPNFLRDNGVASVAVPPETAIEVVDHLRDAGFEVAVDDSAPIAETRATKTSEEVERIRDAVRITEEAMTAAERLLGEAALADESLRYEGRGLTVDRVKREIRTVLVREGYGAGDVIVAQGGDAAEPHNRGSGTLRSGRPIVVDIFPEHTRTGYHADVTRTFLRGTPSEDVRRKYDLVREAQETAIEAIEPGASGHDVHGAVCDVFEARNVPTTRTRPTTTHGFVHVTGHGVGLTVHERPVLGQGGDTLRPGNVVTVEPGYYHPETGGIRIEDVVVVTEEGNESLTDYGKQLVVDVES